MLEFYADFNAVLTHLDVAALIFAAATDIMQVIAHLSGKYPCVISKHHTSLMQFRLG
jgi:hypothetical protein